MIERTFRNRRIRLAGCAAVAVVVAGLAACSGHDDPSGRSSAAATTERPAGSATTSTTATDRTVLAGTPPAAAITSVAAGDCAEVQDWGADPKEAAPMTTEDFYLVRAGQHDCYDRVVFDVNGTIDGPSAIGYSVAYVSGPVTADPSGEPVPTAGAAHLQVGLRAPAFGYGASGHQPWRPATQVGEDYLTADQLRDWQSLREVAFAGSFEGLSTIAIGVESRLPFRVGSYEQDGYSHVYVDIAHPR